MILPSMLYISRMEYSRTAHGWWVRFVRRKVMISHKKFNDQDYVGGKEESLFWAQCWRDDEYERLVEKGIIGIIEHKVCDNRTPPYYGINSQRANNKSGMVGIHKTDFSYIKNGRLHRTYAWQGCWILYVKEGKKIKRLPKRSQFTINRWGEEGAMKMAKKARLDMIPILSSDEQLNLRSQYAIQEGVKLFK